MKGKRFKPYAKQTSQNDISSFYLPSFLQDPWASLLKKLNLK